jgi:hypothetical protein
MQNETLTVKLAGGLGNQLFQLAAAKGAGSKILLIDVSLLVGSDRVFELNPLKSSVNFENYELSQCSQMFTKKIKERKEFLWQSIQAGGNRPSVLSGYFQHPKYAESILREVVEVIESTSKPRKQTYCNCSGEHIAMHIRRGDYLSVPRNKRNFGVLANEYFVSSIGRFSENTHFVAFSDSDIESELLEAIPPTTHLTFAESDLKSWDLLQRMSSMDGIVMSNSSLSWWAARIGMEMRQGFRVVCPNIWFKEIPASQNLILEQWEQLESEWIR